MNHRDSDQKLWVGMMALAILACGGFLLSSCKGKPAAQGQESKIAYYYCPMHTQYHSDKPGDCPICGMKLSPKMKEEGKPAPASGTQRTGERKIKYWKDAMNPSYHSDKPGKAPDGMDLVPVYEEEPGTRPQAEVPDVLKSLAPVNLTPWRQQLIGVKFAQVQTRALTRRIMTVGRFGGGMGDFASAAGDFSASGSVVASGVRYLVADVYALDVPLVKVGQRAWVSPFSGSGSKVEGRVSQIYPYDGTQSRVTRVRINLKAPLARELFANVEIEAATAPKLSVPKDAVLDTGTFQYAYVQEEASHFTPRLVTVGFKGEDFFEITSGLKEGEHVVSGANFLVDADAKLNASLEEEK